MSIVAARDAVFKIIFLSMPGSDERMVIVRLR